MTRMAVLFLTFASICTAQTNKPKPIQVKTPSTQSIHQVVLTWVNPTSCSDGSPCTPSAINLYKLVGSCAQPPPPPSPPPPYPLPGFSLLAALPGTARTYTDTGLADATTYCYYVTALLAQPLAWSATVTYTGGQTVTYNSGTSTNQVYVALNNSQPNLNQPPATSPTFWQLGTVESMPSNLAGGSTPATGPPNPPSNLLITVQ